MEPEQRDGHGRITPRSALRTLAGPLNLLVGRWIFGLILLAMFAVVTLSIRGNNYLPCVGLAVLGLAAAFVLQRILDARRARRAPGCCRGCGYDRAGLAAGAPCPECGRADDGPGPASGTLGE